MHLSCLGIHAREWISPAMCTYIIDQLMMPENSKYIENLNFHILPSANPDGYTYTITDVRQINFTDFFLVLIIYFLGSIVAQDAL